MLKDLRHAFRTLLQAKGWTAVVVLSLALGIGANTALFSAADRLLLTKLPGVTDPDSLVRLRYYGRNDMLTSSSDYGFTRPDSNGQNARSTFSYPMYKQFLTDNKTMTDMMACAPFGQVSLVVDGQAEIATAYLTTGNFYQLLGVKARIGRTILPEDDTPTAPPVAVISSPLWHKRFGTDPAVIGRTVQVNNVAVTIVGVLDPAFIGVQQTVGQPSDVWLPLALDPQLTVIPDKGPPRLQQATYWWLLVMGRLRPGATAEQVQGNLDGVFQSTARASMTSYLSGLPDKERSTVVNRDRTNVPRLGVEPGSRGMYDVGTNDMRSVTILSIVVGLLLLIVCANVANLLLSRAATRQRELSVRLSLGATRLRLIRQLLTESLVLAFIGGGLGVAVGYWGKQLLPGPHGEARALDWRVMAFVAGLAILTGILFGIAPALRATRINLSDALKSTSRSVVGSRSLLGKSLLIVQVAISLVLLAGAGVFLRTLHNLRHVDVGFNPQNLVLFRINPALNRYDETRINALYGQVQERLGAAPGVRGVSMSQPGLLSGSTNSTSFFIQGRTYAPRAEGTGVHRMVIAPNFFDVMEIGLQSGRRFNWHDNQGSPKVAIINEAAARKFFPNESPLGKRFGHSVENNNTFEIVGVAGDAKYSSVRDSPPPTMYVPYLQARTTNPTVAVRTAAAPAAAIRDIRTIVTQVDPNLPLLNVSTQLESVEQRFAQEKLFAQAYALFGGLALLLASIGLFGLMSYNVSRRTSEIGIRMALGAQRRDVLGLVMRESMLLVGIGVVIGVATALGLANFVATLLYGLAPRDPASITLAVVVMIAVSALAGYLPARRAARVDPMVAVRDQ